MAAGLLLLIRGGNWTVDSAVYVAERYGLSPMIVGFTIVAFGTSFSELIVSVVANLKGSPGIAIGNVLGSNIANILLVLGVTAFFVSLRTASRGILIDLLMMLACSVLLVFLLHQGEITRLTGSLMILGLCLYIFLQYKMAQRGELKVEVKKAYAFSSSGKAYAILAAGLLAIGLGAEFLVQGARLSALVIGVPEAVIALSIIAFGTSLPELSTSIVAARKNQGDMVLGNIIGSNVFNILMILGTTALIKPIVQGSFTPQLAHFDVWLVLAVSIVFALIIFLFKGISRMAGFAFVTAYILYNAYIYLINIAA